MENLESLSKDLNVDLEEFMKFYEKTFVRSIPLRLTGITPSEYFHLKKNGVFKFKSVDNQKRSTIKLNLIEALWVRFVYKLKKFDLSVKSIKEIQYFLFEDSDKNLEIETDSLLKIEQFNTEDISKQSKIQIKEAKKKLEKEQLDIDIEIIMTQFGIYVINVLKAGTNIELLIYFNEEEKKLHILPEFNIDKLNPYTEQVKSGSCISINLLGLVTEILADEKFENILLDYQLYDADENNILKCLKRNDVKEITYTKLNDEEFKITIVEQKDILGAEVQNFKRNLGLKNYKKVNVSLRNEKHLIVENRTIEKRKF